MRWGGEKEHEHSLFKLFENCEKLQFNDDMWKNCCCPSISILKTNYYLFWFQVLFPYMANGQNIHCCVNPVEAFVVRISNLNKNL